MKIHIMTDLEGVAGVLNAKDYIYPDSKYYEYACQLATLEVSAAVEGALDGGATEILVVDGHGPGAMKRQLLHPRAKLLTGRPWPKPYPFGIDGTFTAGLLIGQHAKTNTDGGHLCHTMSFDVEEYVLNDLSIGELGLWMLVTGYFGVPLVMVSGDEAACQEAQALSPNVEVAAVKQGLKHGSASGVTSEENQVLNSVAIHLHPDEARALIREHAYRAVKRIPEIAPFQLEPPYKLTIAIRKGAEIKAPRKATAKSKDLLDLLAEQRGKLVAKLRSTKPGRKTKRAPAKAKKAKRKR